jgi:hypothetical protein
VRVGDVDDVRSGVLGGVDDLRALAEEDELIVSLLLGSTTSLRKIRRPSAWYQV